MVTGGWPDELSSSRVMRAAELAFHYCHLPEGQPASPSRPVRAAGLRWPADEDFQFGKDCFGLDQSQVRLYSASARHTVPVMAAVAICAVIAALLRRCTDTQAPAPELPDQPPPAEFGMVPLTVPENRAAAQPPAPSRQHRALAGLAAPPPGPVTLVSPASTPCRNTEIALVSQPGGGPASSPCLAGHGAAPLSGMMR